MVRYVIILAVVVSTLFSVNNFVTMIRQVAAPLMNEMLATSLSLHPSSLSLSRVLENTDNAIIPSLLSLSSSSPSPPSSSSSSSSLSLSALSSSLPSLLNDNSRSSENNSISNYSELLLFPQSFSVHEHYFGRFSRNGTTNATNDDAEDENDVSILTQISLDRFQQVIDLNLAWKGYMSVAVYLKDPEELIQFRKLYLEQQQKREKEQLQQQQLNEQQRKEQQYQYQYGFDLSKVSFHVVFRGNYTGEYPINVLRNVALEHAVTRYVFLLDADFTPSPHARREILKHIRKRRKEQQEQVQKRAQQEQREQQMDSDDHPIAKTSNGEHDDEERIAWVVPAFEREVSAGETVRPEDLPDSKKALKSKIWDEEEYFIFHRSYRKAHSATEYHQWYRSVESYDVTYSVPYEPYVVVDRLKRRRHSLQSQSQLQSQLLSQQSSLPQFHPAFTGYGYSKLSWVEELAASGYKFRVLPSAWVVHINHEHFGKYHTNMRTINKTTLATYLAFQEYVSERYGITWPPRMKSECDFPERKDLFPGLFVQPNYFVAGRRTNNDADTKNATLAASFSSDDDDDDDDIDVTLTTQISIEKFERLVDLYSRWKGHISVAIYIEARLPKDVHKNLWRLKQLIAHNFGDAAAVENTTMTTTTNTTELQSQRLVSFHVVLNRGLYDGEYPINLMRNVAMDYAATTHAFVLDVDFIPSLDAHEAIRRHLQSLELRHQYRAALVVPAFEREIRRGQPKVTVEDLPATKEKLVALLTSSNATKFKRNSLASKRQFFPFHRAYKSGHFPTKYRRWMHSEKPYEIEYQLDYEPYVVVNRGNTNKPLIPRFYEALTGFGRNKQSWIEELAAAEYDFVVLPDVFIVHINHHYGKYELGVRRAASDTRKYYRTFQKCLGKQYNRTWPPPELLHDDDDD